MADTPTGSRAAVRGRLLRGGLRALTGVARVLGPARYGVADVIGLCAYAADGQRRRRTAANHRRADPAIGDAGAAQRARASFREYARLYVDFIWASSLTTEQVLALSEVRGLEFIEAARGTGAILALTHFGSWDMAATIATAHDMQLTTVMAPIGSPDVTELVVWARERLHMEVFTPDRAARGLLRALARRRYVALLCDIPGAGPETVVDYLGGPVVFSTVPAWLAKNTGAPLLPVSCARGGRGEPHFVIQVHPAVEVSGRGQREIMQDLAHALEPDVRARPAQWYPFSGVYVEPATG